MKKMLTSGLAAAVSLLATGAFAQDSLTGVTALNDRLDDIDVMVERDMSRGSDAYRFANPEFRPGWSGSASLSYSHVSGNTDTQDLTIGTRLRYAAGPWVHTLGAAIGFSETDDVRDSEDFFGIYDANYYVNQNVYGFGLLRVQTDGLASTAGDIETDAFYGAGIGYRLLNTQDVAWRVQAGIGQSHLEDGTGDTETEFAQIVSSRFFYAINDNVYASMDTDMLNSDSAFRVNNDLGVTVKMTGALSTRISYLTEFNDSRDIETDNKLGVSLVYGF
jgi:putative salt-induced outer membrane protein